MTRTHRILIIIVAFIATMAILIAAAPKPQHRPVSAASIPASVCGTFGHVTHATLVDQVAGSMATTTYSVTCSDGVTTMWTRP